MNNAPTRRPNGTYLPGVSGNPSGMSRALVEVTDLARQHAPEAMAALVEIATQGKSESARVAAATALLDRGYGRPQALTDIVQHRSAREMTDEEIMAVLLGGLSQEELDERIARVLPHVEKLRELGGGALPFSRIVEAVMDDVPRASAPSSPPPAGSKQGDWF
jgi:hypothetical protein